MDGCQHDAISRAYEGVWFDRVVPDDSDLDLFVERRLAVEGRSCGARRIEPVYGGVRLEFYRIVGGHFVVSFCGLRDWLFCDCG